jgi:hypothetical protein
LIGKAEEADLALEFQASMDSHRRKVPDNVIEFRRECWHRIRAIRKGSANAQQAVDGLEPEPEHEGESYVSEQDAQAS